MALVNSGISRRQLGLMTAGTVLLPTAQATRFDATLLATWKIRDVHHMGLLSVGRSHWWAQRTLDVPTRAHGLWNEAVGSVLAVARRPGDWLLRWHPHTGRTQWHWIDGDRRFNGHVIASANGSTLWTTETDLDTAQGRLGVRDAASLEKMGEWVTHGTDPHQLLALPQAVGELSAGTLMVANGGIPTLPETGRSKRALVRMDASLVALHPQTGALLGQWRLMDPYLSVRHLAWNPISQTLGIALQAEHPDKASQQAAPVLALWNGKALRACSGQASLNGYGGDICALASGGFAVSCPRANRLALFDARGALQRSLGHPEACALASRGGSWWLSGTPGLLRSLPTGEPETVLPARGGVPSLQLDNHWLVLA